MTEKYNESSRFCHLQSSSSSSSEKDLAIGQMKKYSTPLLNYDVQEEVIQEDQKSHGNQDKEVEAIRVQDQDDLAKTDIEQNSLFTFNFLNEDSQPKKEEIPENKEEQKMTNNSPPSNPDISASMNDADDAQFLKVIPDLGSNFHNFFTNDSIFGSPSPPIGYYPSQTPEGQNQNFQQQQQPAPQVKIENHYNQHTTINNYTHNAQQYYNIAQTNYNMNNEGNNKPDSTQPSSGANTNKDSQDLNKQNSEML